MNAIALADVPSSDDHQSSETVPALSEEQETELAAILQSARRPGSQLHFATLPVAACRSLPIFAQLARAHARSQSYLQRGGREWTRRSGSQERLVAAIATLADELTKGASPDLVAIATSATLPAITDTLLVGALDLDHQLRGPARRTPAARAFLHELDEQLTALSASYPSTVLERLDVEAARRAVRDYFIRANIPLAIRRARTVARASRMPLVDLVQTGFEGLIQAVDRFDPSYGPPFVAYAYPWIKQRIRRLEGSADLVSLPHRIQAVRSDLRRAVLAAAGDGSANRLATVAAQVGRPEHVVEAVLRADAPVLSLEGVTAHVLAERHADERQDLDTNVLLEERCRAVREALSACTPRGREVLERLFGIGCAPLSGTELARALGLSWQRVYEIRDQELRRLRRPPVARKLVAVA